MAPRRAYPLLQLCLFLAACGAFLSSPAFAQLIPINRSLSGIWTDANWSGGLTPNSGNNATITSGTVTLSDPRTLGALTFSGGAVSGAGSLTVAAGPFASFTWNAGDLQSTLNTAGTVTISSNGNVRLFDGAQLNLTSGATWTGGTIQTGGSTTTITNQSGGTFTAAGNDTLANNLGNGRANFANLGTFTKSTGTGTTDIQINFTNTGTVNVGTGTLLLSGGGSSSSQVNLAAGAALRINSTAFSFTNGTALNGPGTLELIGATTTFSGTTTGNANLLINSGTADFQGTHAVNNFSFVNGSANGTGILNTAGTFTWTAGDIRTRINSNGGATLSSNSNARIYDGAQLNLDGTTNWTSGNIQTGGSTTIITNKSGATFLATTDNTLANNLGNGRATFANLGTFTKSTGTGVTDIQTTFTNTGIVNANTGTLLLSGGGTSATSVNIASGAIVRIISTPFGFTNGSAINGPGTLELGSSTTTFSGTTTGNANLLINSGTADFQGTHAVNNFSFVNGSANGTGILNTAGTFTWTAGDIRTRINSNGGTTISSNSNARIYDGALLNLDGTTNWTSGNIQTGGASTIITNKSGATFLATTDNTLANNLGNGRATFANLGTFTKSTGTGVTDIQTTFTNTGIVNANTGTLVLSGGGTSSTPVNIASGAIVRIISTPFGFTNGATINGPGTLELTNSTTTFSGTTSGTTNVLVNGGTVDFQGTHGVNQLAFTNGSIGGAGTLNTAGAFTWTAGDLRTRLNSNGGTVISSNDNARIYDGAQLGLFGTTQWTSGNIQSGGSSTTITNNAGATFTAASNHSFANNLGNGRASFVNAGTFVKSTGTGLTDIQVAFANTGTVNANTGTLQFSGGGSSSTALNIASGAAVRILSTNFAFSHGAVINGPGNLELHGATTTFSGTTTGHANLHVSNATAAFDGTHAVNGFSFASGTASGGGTLNVAGPFSWTAGDIRTRINSNGGGTIGSNDGARIYDGAQLALDGATTWSSGVIQTGGASTIITNKAGASFTAASNNVLANNLGNGRATFANLGTFTKSTGTGTTDVQTTFDNSGAVNVNSGILLLSGAGTGTGTFTAADGATLRFSNGYTLASGATLAGAGTHQLTGGTLTVAGAITPSSFAQTSGVVSGAGSLAAGRLTLTGGSLSLPTIGLTSTGSDWSGGDLNGTGTLTIAAAATLALSSGNSKDFNQRTIVNEGTVTWNMGYLRGGTGSTFTNAAGATFLDLNANGYSVHNPFGGTFSFINSGTYRRDTTGTTFFDVPFTNHGVVDLRNGEIQYRAGGSVGPTGSMIVASGTTAHFTAGYSVANAASLTGAGTYRLSSGNFTATGIFGTTRFLQTGGTLFGAHTLSGVFDWHGGDWSAASVDAGITTTVGAGATVNISTGSSHDFNYRKIANHGTFNWDNGYIRAGNGSVFTNSSTFNDVQTTGHSIHNAFGGSFTFVNDGQYRRNAPGTTSFIDVPFANNASVDVQAGDLQFRAGGSVSATGTITAAAGSNVHFTHGFTIANGVSLAGAGSYWLTGGVFDVTGSLALSTFNQTNGVLEGVNTLHGLINWTGGSWSTDIAGRTTTIASTSTVNLGGGNNKDFHRRHIINQGTVNWNGGYIRAGNGSVFTNSGTFNDHNPSSWTIHNAFGGTFTFVNQGTYKREAAGTSYIDVPFENHATVDLRQGDLQFRGGGHFASGGTLIAANGTNVYFTNDFTVANAASLTGAGIYWLTNGILDVTGNLNIPTFNQTGGRLAGTQQLHGIFNWTGGEWSANAPGPQTTILAGGALNMTSGNSKDFNHRAITNAGTTTWEAGYIRAGNGATFTNTGEFRDKNTQGYTVHNAFGGTFTFANQGNYIRDVTGTTYFDTPFDNAGTINLQLGDIQIRAGGTMSASSRVATSAGTNLHFTQNYTIADGAEFTGAGIVRQSGGTLTLNGTLRASAFHWHGGDWNTGSAATTILAPTTALDLVSSNGKGFSGRAIVNQGTVTWHGGHIQSGQGGSFTNAAGGSFLDQNVSSYSIHAAYGGAFSFINHGQYVKSTAGITSVDVPFANHGSLTITGGAMHFNGAFTNTGGVHFANGATARFSGHVTFDGPLTGTGTIEATAVTAAGLVSPGNSAGSLTITGNLTLLSTSALLIELGSTVQGTGYDFLGAGGTGAIAGNLSVGFLNNFQTSILGTDSFSVLRAEGTTALTGAFANVANGQRLFTSDGLGSFRVNYGLGSTFAANSVVLSEFQAIPEPSTYVLLGLGASVVGWTVRRRRR